MGGKIPHSSVTAILREFHVGLVGEDRVPIFMPTSADVCLAAMPKYSATEIKNS